MKARVLVRAAPQVPPGWVPCRKARALSSDNLRSSHSLSLASRVNFGHLFNFPGSRFSPLSHWGLNSCADRKACCYHKAGWSSPPRARVPACPCPRVPASPCACVPVSPCARMPVSPCAHVPACPCPHVPLCPHPRGPVPGRVLVRLLTSFPNLLGKVSASHELLRGVVLGISHVSSRAARSSPFALRCPGRA